MRLSATRLKMYLLCPRQYRYRYVDRIETLPSAALAFGRVLHEVLHNLFLQEPQDHEGEIAFVVSEFDRLWIETIARDSPVFDEKSPTPADLRRLAYEILMEFVSGQQDQPRPLLVEFPFELSLGEHAIAGIIDRVDAGTSGLVVVDYKSGKHKPKREDVETDLQLTVYAFAASRLFSLPVEQVVYYHLRDQTPIPARRDERDYDTLCFSIIPYVAEAITAGLFPPHYGYWCRWCDYREQCADENQTTTL